MHILCPHCRNPIEVVKLTPREEIGCPSCGSSFCLETESTTGWAPGGRLPPGSRVALTEVLLRWYREDPDPGLHAAAGWLLRHRLGRDLDDLDRELASPRPIAERRWYVNRHGQTFAVCREPIEFVMGSPDYEPERNPAVERQIRVRIPRSFAIAVCKVTQADFARFLADCPEVGSMADFTSVFSNRPEQPVGKVNWLQAARYCRWLSEREGVPPEQMCYPPVAEIKDGMKLPADYLTRTGYRLPTQAEWEYACRAKAVTSRHFGTSETLLPHYAWYKLHGNRRCQPVGLLRPNDFGLFDTFGNLWEWCIDRWRPRREWPADFVLEDREDDPAVAESDRRVIKGSDFSDHLSAMRAAYYEWLLTADSTSMVGFRVARTCP